MDLKKLAFWSVISKFNKNVISIVSSFHINFMNKFLCYQGYNARKVISEVYAYFVLQCTVSWRYNVNTRRISQPDMGSVIWNYYVNYQNYQNLMLLSSSDTKRTLMHLFLFPPRENCFQYVRRVYSTAINFPCIITLMLINFYSITQELLTWLKF